MTYIAHSVAELRALISTAPNGVLREIELLPGKRYEIADSVDGANAFARLTGTKNISIFGRGAVISRKNGSENFRFFEIEPGNTLKLYKLTCANGRFGSTLDTLAHGGAIFNKGELHVLECTFENNSLVLGSVATSNTYGGAIEIATDNDVYIYGCIFRNNLAKTGGALHQDSGTTHIHNTLFYQNQADADGSAGTTGAYGGAIQALSGELNIELCQFVRNSAKHVGGAIYCHDARFSVSYSDFIENKAVNGGCYYDRDSSQSNFSVNQFYGNVSNSLGRDFYVENGFVNAENNWWGSTLGPLTSGAGTAKQDSVSANVDFTPYVTQWSAEHTAQVNCKQGAELYSSDDAFESKNPISLIKGEKRWNQVDISLQSVVAPLEMIRTYRQSQQSTLQFMGLGWTHDHIQYVGPIIIGVGTPNYVDVYQGSGGFVRFYETPTDNTKFRAAAGSNAKLSFSGTNPHTSPVLKTADKVKYIFATTIQNNRYLLIRREWPNGNVWSYTYDANGQLITVKDNWERELAFTYYISPEFKEGQLASVEAKNNGISAGVVVYDYTPEMEDGQPISGDPKALLSEVSDLLGNTWEYQYYGSQLGQIGGDPTPLNFMIYRRSPTIANQGNYTVTLEELSYDVVNGIVEGIVQKRGDNLLETAFEFHQGGDDQTTETVANSQKIHKFKRGLLSNSTVANSIASTGDLEPSGVFRPKSQTDANNNTTSLGWNEDGEFLTNIADASGAITSFEYERDQNGNFTEDSRLVARVEGDGRTTHYVYDELRQPTLVLMSSGNRVVDVKGDMENVADWDATDVSVINELSLDPQSGYLRRVVTQANNQGIESNVWDIESGKSYELSARVFPLAGCVVTMKVPGVTELVLSSSGSGAWQSLTITYVAQSNASAKTVQVVASSSGEFLVDYVSLKEDGVELLNDRLFEGDESETWIDIDGATPQINQRLPGADTGKHSRYVIAITSAEGIVTADTFAIIAEKRYILFARIYVISGQVKMVVPGITGFSTLTSTTTLNSWQTIRLLCKANISQASSQVCFLSENGGAEFYVDTVHLIELDELYSWQEYRYDYASRVLEERSINVDTLKISRETIREYYIGLSNLGLLRKLTDIDPDGVANNNWTTYEYDAAGRPTLLSKGSMLGSCDTSYTVYNAAGNVVATICNYDAGSNPPPTDAQSAAALYNSAQPTKNRVTTFAYDELGRQYLTTVNAGSEFSISTYTVFDSLDRVRLSINNYNPEVSSGVYYTAPYTWTWDAGAWIDASIPAKTISHGSNLDQNIINQTEYNELGLTRLQRDVAGRISLSGYDLAGRLIKSVRNASVPDYDNTFDVGGDPALANYPGLGNPLSAAPDEDLIYEQLFDAVGNIVKTKSNPNFSSFEQITLTTYDALNRLQKVVASAQDYDILADRHLDSYDFSTAPDRDLVSETYYDLMGRVSATIDASGSVNKTVYDVPGRPILTIANYAPQIGSDGGIVDPLNWKWVAGRWQYLYNPDPEVYYPVDHSSLGVVIGINDQNIVSETVYDGAGRVECTRDTLGKVTYFVYDGLGRQIKTIINYMPQTTLPSAWEWRVVSGIGGWRLSASNDSLVFLGSLNDQNLITATSYDGDGKPFETRNPEGLVTRNVYDSLGRQVKTIRNYMEQATTPFQWKWRDVSNQWAWRLSDSLNDVVDQGTREDENQVSEVQYDAQGRVELERDSRGNATYNVYDKQGRQLKTITNYVPLATSPDKWVWRLHNGTWAWRLSETNEAEVAHGPANDQNIISATEQFDLFGRVTITRDNAGVATYAVYDQLGRQTRRILNYIPQATVPEQWSWREYDGEWGWYLSDTNNARVLHGSQNDSNIIEETLFNKAGQAIEIRDARGTASTTTYDRAGRSLIVAHAAGTANELKSYTCYDKDGRVLRTIQHWIDNGVSPDSKSGDEWEFSPDTHGVDNDQNLITTYQFDASGRVKQQTNPDGHSIATIHDLDGQPSRTTDSQGVATIRLYDGMRRTQRIIQNYFDQRTRIAFESDRDRVDKSEHDIYVMNEDGTGVLRLTTAGENNEGAAWSPDGTKIAFFRRTPSGYQVIYTMNSDGTLQTAITAAEAYSFYPTWATNSKIIYKSLEVSGFVLKIMDSNGSNQQAIWAAPADRDIYFPHCSWALNKIVFELNHTDAAFESDIAVINPDGSGFELLVANGARNRNAVWSPDGTKIVFDSTINQIYQIYVMRHDGSEITQLTFTEQANTFPTWSPDGQQIFFYSRRDQMAERQPYIMNADGTNQRRITENYSADFKAAWSPIQTNPATWEWDLGWYNEITQAVHHGQQHDVNVIVDVLTDVAGRTIELRNPGGIINGFPTGGALTASRYDKLGRRISYVMNYEPQGTDPANWVWSATNSRWELSTSDSTPVDRGNNDTNAIVQTNYKNLLSESNITGETRTITTKTDGIEVVRDFDRLGRAKSIDYGDPASTPTVEFLYDLAGNRLEIVESGVSSTVRKTGFSHDGMHRLANVSFDENGDGSLINIVGYEYDVAGNRTKLSMPSSKIINYTYNARNQVISLTDWDAQQSRFIYDGAGRHAQTLRANGLTSDYRYDASGHLRLLRHTAGRKTFAHFAYDVDARGNRTRALEMMHNPGNGTTIISQSDSAVIYRGTWSAVGGFRETAAIAARLSLMFAGDDVVELTMGEGPDHGRYDVYIGGSLWQTFDGYAASTGERVIPLSLFGEGPFTLEIINRADRGPSSTGNKLRFKQLVSNILYSVRTITYDYDGISRVLDARYYPGINSAATPVASSYQYDLAGNLTDTNSSSRIFNKLNQLVMLDSDVLSYDANGNLIDGGTDIYTWDRANRLVSMGGHNYAYDGMGNRVSQTANSIATRYLLDLQPSLIQVIGATVGSNTERYVHSLRGIHATEDTSSNWHNTLQDDLGSVRSEVSAILTVGASGTYQPYGLPDNVAGTYSQPFRFTGEMRDMNALQYHRARYFSPDIGNWLTMDTYQGQVLRPLSLNSYTWAEGNPINLTDPSGYCIEKQFCDAFEAGSFVWQLVGCKSNCNSNLLEAEISKLKLLRQRVDVTPDLQLDMVDFLGDRTVLYIKDRIKLFEAGLVTLGGITVVADVLNAFKNLVQSGAPLDVKQKYGAQFGPVVWLANDFYAVDVTGNILYGYVGEFVNMGYILLRVGGGYAQLNESPTALGPITCFFDKCEDQAAVVAGIQLYQDHGIFVSEADIAGVLEQYAGQLKKPPQDYWKRSDVNIDIGYISGCLAPDTYQNRLAHE